MPRRNIAAEFVIPESPTWSSKVSGDGAGVGGMALYKAISLDGTNALHLGENTNMRMFVIISDPAVLLCYSKTSVGKLRLHRVWARNQKLKRAESRLFLIRYRDIPLKRKLCININTSISTATSLHSVDLRSLPTFSYSLLVPAKFVFVTRLKIPASNHTLRQQWSHYYMGVLYGVCVCVCMG